MIDDAQKQLDLLQRYRNKIINLKKGSKMIGSDGNINFDLNLNDDELNFLNDNKLPKSSQIYNEMSKPDFNMENIMDGITNT